MPKTYAGECPRTQENVSSLDSNPPSPTLTLTATPQKPNSQCLQSESFRPSYTGKQAFHPAIELSSHGLDDFGNSNSTSTSSLHPQQSNFFVNIPEDLNTSDQDLYSGRNASSCPLKQSFGGQTGLSEGFPHATSRDSTLTSCEQDQSHNRLWTRIQRLYNWEATHDPLRYVYDMNVVPKLPLGAIYQTLLTVTELPFMILWVYFAYWTIITCLTVGQSPASIWPTAIVAGLLVGIGLNANAHRSIFKIVETSDASQQQPSYLDGCKDADLKSRRSRLWQEPTAVQYEMQTSQLGPINRVRKVPDWGMILRFFIIPFGVSSLSGLTNSNREHFLLVFPRQIEYLLLALLYPAFIVIVLALMRLYLIWKLKIRWSFRIFLMNGYLVS